MRAIFNAGRNAALLILLFISYGFISHLSAAGNYYFVKSNASGANDGSSWGNAFRDLQDAFDVSLFGDTIFVAEGIYYPDRGTSVTLGNRNAAFQLIDGVVLMGGYKGNEMFSKSVDNEKKYWRNWRKNKTIISGDLQNNDNDNVAANEPTRSDNSYHVFFTQETVDSTTEINGFYIEGGNANFPNLVGSSGGGLYAGNSFMRITNCVFRNNSALETGGAIFTPAGYPHIKGVVFINNSAKNGGAVYMTGNDHLNHATLAFITNSYFYNNSASQKGGGLYNAFGVNPLVMNTVFAENSSTMGGGCYSDPRSYPNFTNCTFYNNSASTSGGGTVLCAGSIVNAIFRANTAPTGSQILLERLPDYPTARHFANSCVQGGFQGSQILDFDPQFVNPNDLAGIDSTFGTSDDGLILQSSSRAINAGLAYLYEFADVRGYPRQSGNIPDMGAYEHQRVAIDYKQLYDELKNGSYTLIYRHGMTDWRTTDQPAFNSDLSNCSLQRNLSHEGRDQVEYLGNVIRLLEIPVDTSISSPACRCIETGIAISGGAKLKLEWMLTDSASQGPRLEDMYRIPPAGLNSVISTHMGTIGVVTSFPMGEVNEGDVVVIKATGTSFQEIAQITTDTWERIIEFIPNEGSSAVDRTKLTDNFILYDNYPNPFNPVTTIEYTIPKAEQVVLRVYDAIGSQVKELVNEYKGKGNYRVQFDAASLSSGVYFYTINAGDFSKTKKLVVMK